MPLFRPESLRSQDRLHGDVNLAPPTSWQTLGIAFVALFAAFLGFISFSHYSRVATASGSIESDRGLVRIDAGPGGTVSSVHVREGDRVQRGQLIATISRSTASAGGTLEERRIRALEEERSALEKRAPALRGSAEARIQGAVAEADAARSDQREIERQMVEQRALIEAARTDLDKANAVAVRGFISQRDIRIREEALAARQQGLSRLAQALTSARSSERGAQQRIAQERADLASALADVDTGRASIAGRQADTENVAAIRIVSPVDGIVADLGGAVAGQSLSAGQQVVTVLPAGGRLRVRLQIPADAVAMVAPGQTARIAVDAFPFQTYGTVEARIERVSEAAVRDAGGEAFVALASLSSEAVTAYGKPRRIRPGMTVTARIKTMERTLAQWLLDPLYAVSRR